MNEASKAMRRRYMEEKAGGFQWMRLFKGRGIDVGCGPDKIPFPKCEPFDVEQGDANKLHEYFPENTFNYLHASQTLEHMVDPRVALESWIKVVKPKGYLIISVPDYVLYEGGSWPSRYNPDHKSTWSMSLRGSKAGSKHVYIPDFFLDFFPTAEVIRCETLATNYNYSMLFGSKDQTFHESRGVEAFIEFVLRKIQ